MSRSNAGYEKKESNKREKEKRPRAVREIPFPVRSRKVPFSFWWQVAAHGSASREERSANGQPLCLPCLTFVSVHVGLSVEYA
jgi:hypothetical protein